MKITYKKVMDKNPCYDPYEKYGISKKKKLDLIDVFGMRRVPIPDKIWIVIEFLPEIEQRRFAIWCARRCKTSVIEITDYIDAIEDHYIHGTITYEAMRVAYWTADWTADWAAYRAAYWAADRAAYWAADRAAYWAADRAERKSQLRELKSIVIRLEAADE